MNEIMEHLEGIRNVIPQLELPLTENNLRILLAITNTTKICQKILGEVMCQMAQTDNVIPISPEIMEEDEASLDQEV